MSINRYELFLKEFGVNVAGDLLEVSDKKISNYKDRILKKYVNQIASFDETITIHTKILKNLVLLKEDSKNKVKSFLLYYSFSQLLNFFKITEEKIKELNLDRQYLVDIDEILITTIIHIVMNNTDVENINKEKIRNDIINIFEPDSHYFTDRLYRYMLTLECYADEISEFICTLIYAIKHGKTKYDLEVLNKYIAYFRQYEYVNCTGMQIGITLYPTKNTNNKIPSKIKNIVSKTYDSVLSQKGVCMYNYINEVFVIEKENTLSININIKNTGNVIVKEECECEVCILDGHKNPTIYLGNDIKVDKYYTNNAELIVTIDIKYCTVIKELLKRNVNKIMVRSINSSSYLQIDLSGYLNAKREVLGMNQNKKEIDNFSNFNEGTNKFDIETQLRDEYTAMLLMFYVNNAEALWSHHCRFTSDKTVIKAVHYLLMIKSKIATLELQDRVNYGTGIFYGDFTINALKEIYQHTNILFIHYNRGKDNEDISIKDKLIFVLNCMKTNNII